MVDGRIDELTLDGAIDEIKKPKSGHLGQPLSDGLASVPDSHSRWNRFEIQDFQQMKVIHNRELSHTAGSVHSEDSLNDAKSNYVQHIFVGDFSHRELLPSSRSSRRN